MTEEANPVLQNKATLKQMLGRELSRDEIAALESVLCAATDLLSALGPLNTTHKFTPKELALTCASLGITKTTTVPPVDEAPVPPKGKAKS